MLLATSCATTASLIKKRQVAIALFSTYYNCSIQPELLKLDGAPAHSTCQMLSDCCQSSACTAKVPTYNTQPSSQSCISFLPDTVVWYLQAFSSKLHSIQHCQQTMISMLATSLASNFLKIQSSFSGNDLYTRTP